MYAFQHQTGGTVVLMSYFWYSSKLNTKLLQMTKLVLYCTLDKLENRIKCLGMIECCITVAFDRIPVLSSLE